MLDFQQKRFCMKQYLPVLSASALFRGFSDEEILKLLSCIKAQVVSFSRGSVILHQDDPAHFFGLVLSGSVQVLHQDHQGAHSIISVFRPGDTFAEAFACAGIPALPVNAVAAADSTVLLFDADAVLSSASSHPLLITNLLRMIAGKNLQISRKLEIVMQRTTRGKLIAYLSAQAEKAHCDRFAIPFNRQELADYLGVERSAMSTELGRLKKEGLIDFYKNEFILRQR